MSEINESVSQAEKVKYEAQDRDAHYEVGIKDGVVYAERYYFLYPGWANCAGITTNIRTGRKRAIVTRIRWTAGFNNQYIVEGQKFILISHANAFMQRLFEIANERDDVERQALTLQLARDIIDVIEADYK